MTSNIQDIHPPVQVTSSFSIPHWRTVADVAWNITMIIIAVSVMAAVSFSNIMTVARYIVEVWFGV